MSYGYAPPSITPLMRFQQRCGFIITQNSKSFQGGPPIVLIYLRSRACRPCNSGIGTQTVPAYTAIPAYNAWLSSIIRTKPSQRTKHGHIQNGWKLMRRSCLCCNNYEVDPLAPKLFQHTLLGNWLQAYQRLPHDGNMYDM